MHLQLESYFYAVIGIYYMYLLNLFLYKYRDLLLSKETYYAVIKTY